MAEQKEANDAKKNTSLIRDQRIRNKAKHLFPSSISLRCKQGQERKQKGEEGKGKRGRSRGKEGGRKGEKESLNHPTFAIDLYTITVCTPREELPVIGQIQAHYIPSIPGTQLLLGRMKETMSEASEK